MTAFFTTNKLYILALRQFLLFEYKNKKAVMCLALNLKSCLLNLKEIN